MGSIPVEFRATSDGASTNPASHSVDDAIDLRGGSVYQHCGEQHLHRHFAEFDFRYDNRVIVQVDPARTSRDSARRVADLEAAGSWRVRRASGALGWSCTATSDRAT